ncbi:unnamed protein product, partial [Pelagomonas calceolata]
AGFERGGRRTAARSLTRLVVLLGVLDALAVLRVVGRELQRLEPAERDRAREARDQRGRELGLEHVHDERLHARLERAARRDAERVDRDRAADEDEDRQAQEPAAQQDLLGRDLDVVRHVLERRERRLGLGHRRRRRRAARRVDAVLREDLALGRRRGGVVVVHDFVHGDRRRGRPRFFLRLLGVGAEALAAPGREDWPSSGRREGGGCRREEAKEGAPRHRCAGRVAANEGLESALPLRSVKLCDSRWSAMNQAFGVLDLRSASCQRLDDLSQAPGLASLVSYSR